MNTRRSRRFKSMCVVQGLNKEVKNVSEEVRKCQEVLEGCDGGRGGGDGLVEEVLEGLDERLRLMDSLLEQRCDSIRDRLQEHTIFQVGVFCCFLFFFCNFENIFIVQSFHSSTQVLLHRKK